MESLSKGLQKNTVMYIFSTVEYNMQILCSFVQKLKEIDLSENEIGSDGAKYLAQVLENKTVVILTFPHFVYTNFC